MVSKSDGTPSIHLFLLTSDVLPSIFEDFKSRFGREMSRLNDITGEWCACVCVFAPTLVNLTRL